MSSRILYQDHTVALSTDAVVLRGFTKILGRPRRIPLEGITSFTTRDRNDSAAGNFPAWGVSDEGVWYTRDRRRFHRETAIELTFENAEKIGFTPAHPSRFRDLLLQLSIQER